LFIQTNQNLKQKKRKTTLMSYCCRMVLADGLLCATVAA